MKKFILVALTCTLLLQGCAPVVIGGAATTASVIHDRRTTGTVIDDTTLSLHIRHRLGADKAIADNSHINVTVYNRQVLLTGEAFNQQIRARAETITKATEGAEIVQNQIVIGRRSSLLERAYDSKQTAKVKTALLDVKAPGFDLTRVKVTTEHGITYLMGLVSEREALEVEAIVSRVSGVKRVVTLFEVHPILP